MTTTPKQKNPPKQINDGFHVVNKVLGADTYMVMADSASHVEDEFSNMYYAANSQSKTVLKPPFLPAELMKLVYQNNILNQCVEVMEVNIDGTGYDFVPIEVDGKEDEGEKKRLEELFAEPYPGISFTTIRRKMRRDMEGVGYAALEILTNIGGEIVGFRNMDTYNLRFIKLDTPVMVQKTVQRDGKDVLMQYMDRERRFIQRLGNKLIYYREYGTTREVHKETGDWEEEGTAIAPEMRGTQLLIFGVNPDVDSPYSVPRWVNQLPSVIGSRKAEEQNLEFLDAGGVPPAIVFVQGGTLAGSAAEQLRGYLSGKNKNKHRAVVVEAQSSSGSLESAGSVKVSVERFGSDHMRDAMYSIYDKNTEEHIRVGFRIPSLFLGRTDNYNYATAVVAYMVAEEQVFQPERTEFDEIINKTIVKAIGAKTMKLKSRGITLKDVNAQIQALTLAAPMSEGIGFIEQVNEVAGLNLKYQKPEAVPGAIPGQPQQQGGKDSASAADGKPADGKATKPPAPGMRVTITNAGGVQHGSDGTNVSAPKDSTPSIKSSTIIDLAMMYGQMRGLLKTNFDLSEDDKEYVQKSVSALIGAELEAFNSVVAAYVFNTPDADLVNLVDCAHGH